MRLDTSMMEMPEMDSNKTPMGVIFKTFSRPEMSVFSLPSYFTSSSACNIRHHFCVCDIHKLFFFFASKELLSTGRKDRENCSHSLATQEMM